MKELSQGAVEYMLMLAAVLIVVASIISLIVLTSNSLGSSIKTTIEGVRENVIGGLTALLR